MLLESLYFTKTVNMLLYLVGQIRVSEKCIYCWLTYTPLINQVVFGLEVL